MANHHKELPEPDPANLAPPNLDYTYFESANEHPFRPGVVGFDAVNAAWLADAALLAYGTEDLIHEKVTEAGLTGAEVKFFACDGTECFVLHSPSFFIVAFRGTQIDRVGNPIDLIREGIELRLPADFFQLRPFLFPNLFDSLTDAQFIPGLEGTHLGFRKALARVWEGEEGVRAFLDGLRQQQERPVWFTGHSLGAALATLAAQAYEPAGVQGLYTFGSPRVGNADFAKVFEVPCVRFVHGFDVVTQLPLGGLPFRYHHIGDPVMHITSEGAVVADSSLSDPNVPMGLPSLYDHAPIYYASKLWNLVWR